MRNFWLAIILLTGAGVSSTGAFPASAQTEQSEPLPAPRVSNFSGKIVPRFEHLQDDLAYGRRGPSKEYPITWVYERKSLPLLVIKETQDWWRVRDHDGDESWMSETLFKSSDDILVRSGTSLRQKPDRESVIIAHLEAGVIAELLTTSDDWLKIKADQYTGYVPAGDVWGHLQTASGEN